MRGFPSGDERNRNFKASISKCVDILDSPVLFFSVLDGQVSIVSCVADARQRQRRYQSSEPCRLGDAGRGRRGRGILEEFPGIGADSRVLIRCPAEAGQPDGASEKEGRGDDIWLRRSWPSTDATYAIL